MGQRKVVHPAAANSNNFAWGLFNNIVGFPGKFQGFVLNTIVNTIDRVQTEQALRETRIMLAQESDLSKKKESGHSNNVQ